MQTLDILILTIVLAGVVRGLVTGAVRQVLGLIGMILAIVIALQWMDVVGPIFGGYVGANGSAATAIGFLFLFMLVQIAVFFVVRGVEALLKALNLSALNRMAGGLTGGLKAALLLSAFFLLLGPLEVPQQETRRSSRFYWPIASAVPVTWDFFAARIPVFQQATGRLIDRLVLDPDEQLPAEGDQNAALPASKE